MASNNLAKKIFVLIFLLAVLVAIFIWQGNGFSRGYLSWLKTGIAKVNPFDRMIGPELELAKDSGLDLSEVNIEEIIADQPEAPKEEKIEEASLEEVVIEDQEREEEEPQVLGEEVIIGIGGPIEPIIEDPVVISEKKMTLGEIEQEVNRITKEVDRIDKDVQALVALYE
jgi:hypothetical protein